MRRFFYAFLFLSIASSAFASGFEGELEFGAGYRTDSLDWNIAGDITGGNDPAEDPNIPNILSELTWSDLEIYQERFGGRAVIEERLYLRGFLSYGAIQGGRNQDSDYLGDGRTQEFSRSNNDAGGGGVFDFSFGGGYKFGGGTFSFIPLLGYSYHEQNLRMRNGFQTVSRCEFLEDVGISGCPPPLGPFEGLDSTYEARWRGAWTGFDTVLNLTKAISFSGGLEYHWADYKAEADWNLRSDFTHPVSFIHEADGTGWAASVGSSFAVSDRWSIGLDADYRKWKAGPGLDWTFFPGGFSAATRLNEVNWESSSAMLSFKYSL